MEPVELYTTNREFKIVLWLEEKKVYFNEYAKYNCHIDFYNSIGQIVLPIVCSELDLFNTIQEINCMIIDFGAIYSDIIHFGNNESLIGHFMYIALKEQTTNEEPSPLEDDDIIQFNIYQTDISMNNKLRIFFEADYTFLDDFMCSMAELITQVPYFSNIVQLSEKEFLDSLYG
jgi:hypothetical protein